MSSNTCDPIERGNLLFEENRKIYLLKKAGLSFASIFIALCVVLAMLYGDITTVMESVEKFIVAFILIPGLLVVLFSFALRLSQVRVYEQGLTSGLKPINFILRKDYFIPFNVIESFTIRKNDKGEAYAIVLNTPCRKITILRKNFKKDDFDEIKELLRMNI